MKALIGVLWAICCCRTVAGPFVFPGEHPNYDSQFSPELVRTYADEALLAMQFPQYRLVYQPPLIGYLSPTNPAALIIWTTLRLPIDPFEQANLEGYPTGPPVQPPNPPRPAGEIPEPGTVWMYGMSMAAAGLVRWRLVNRPARRSGDRRRGHARN